MPRVTFSRKGLHFCIYCGKPSNTREHCPSKVFLEKPYPDDLPVLPACFECNNSFSSDELYTKMYIKYYPDCGMYFDEEVKNKVKEKARFFESDGFPAGKFLVFEIEANAFLWKMVRTLVGTFIEFERDGKDSDFFRKVIEAKDRKLAGVTAPPQGLFLWQIKFDGIRRHV